MKKTFYIFLLLCTLCSITATNIYLKQISYKRFEDCRVLSSNNVKKVIYDMFIDLEEHNLYLFNDNKIIKKYKIAGGKNQTPSPCGVWKINHKAYWGEGFGGYWLGLNVPWGLYGIHGTTKPSSIGKNASHGCIRMHNNDVQELFDMVPYKTKVYIYSGPYGALSNGYRQLKLGDIGSDILLIQMVLKKKGYYSFSLDGKYGDLMEQALYKYETDNNMAISKIITKETFRKLDLFEFE